MRPMLVALLVLPLAMSACSRDDGGSAPPEVLDAGSEPRRDATLEVRGGTRRVALDVELAVGLDRGRAAEGGTVVGPLRVDLVLEPEDSRSLVRVEGARMGAVDTASKGFDAELHAQWVADLAKAGPAGRRGSLDVDSHGRFTNLSLDIPAQASPNVRQLLQSVKSALELLVVPRPESPIGIGARLRDRRDVELSGMRLALDATYVLAEVEADGETFVFDADLVLHGLPQVLELPPSSPKGSRAELLAADARGKGRIRVSRGDVLALPGSTLELPVSMDVRMQHGGQEDRMRSSILLRYALVAPAQ